MTGRFFNLLELKNLGESVFGTDDGFHVIILSSREDAHVISLRLVLQTVKRWQMY